VHNSRLKKLSPKGLLGFHEQSYTLSSLLLPYRLVVHSLLYDHYRMGGASASTWLMNQLVQAAILPRLAYHCPNQS